MEEKCVCGGGKKAVLRGGEEEKKEDVFAAEAEWHSLSVGGKDGPQQMTGRNCTA